MRRDYLAQQLWVRLREELVVVVDQLCCLEGDRPEELTLAFSAGSVVDMVWVERKVAEMEVVDRRPIVDPHHVGARGDVARLAAREVVEPDAVAVDGIVFDAADEEGIIERGLRLRAGRQGDQKQSEEKPRSEI
jgi:hypothetical protein